MILHSISKLHRQRLIIIFWQIASSLNGLWCNVYDYLNGRFVVNICSHGLPSALRVAIQGSASASLAILVIVMQSVNKKIIHSAIFSLLHLLGIMTLLSSLIIALLHIQSSWL